MSKPCVKPRLPGRPPRAPSFPAIAAPGRHGGRRESGLEGAPCRRERGRAQTRGGKGVSEQVSRFPVVELEELPADLRLRVAAIAEKSGFVPNIFRALG